MTDDLRQLPPFDAAGVLRMVVETPRGASVKIALDGRHFAAVRALPLGQCYAYDWGFIPGTCAADGDPLDAVALHDTSTYPGVVVSCRAIGAVRLEQDGNSGERQSNDRVIVIPVWNERMAEVANLAELPVRLRAELEQFFHTVSLFTAKHVRITGWENADGAAELIKQNLAVA